MATIERLKKRPDFLAAAEGRRFHTERMTAQGRLRNPDACPGLRLGFTITKRVGHATERNRIRRRLRAALSVVASDLPGELAGLPADIVLIARRPALEAAFETLTEDLRRAIPAVTRPAAARGDRPSGRSGGRRSGPTPDKTLSQTSSFPHEAGRASAQAAPTGGADIGPSQGCDRDPRITGARRSSRAGDAPVATPNACGGVPDGQ
ncbi:ribonuclease P protein component [Methylobacterium sp. PvP062]|uniref:Ribonuclease P protein component n=1 Tax=Methylobacterium radiotolerans TaxID=31998 RepID=A0ABV2NK12_9HYPH|nr:MULTISPECIES: ribonuclease P protein component [unclassified Methylobacterium]MBP2496491.1 ribonuclease P protein component [Methylobacterium sp. PvP105]MBP2503638.1 ribonuclease P protein component [Methylobacterium sp. PvP109]MCX7332474.1 ribonuclease P protein component [Hyphomicrobiales bacterium]